MDIREKSTVGVSVLVFFCQTIASGLHQNYLSFSPVPLREVSAQPFPFLDKLLSWIKRVIYSQGEKDQDKHYAQLLVKMTYMKGAQSPSLIQWEKSQSPSLSQWEKCFNLIHTQINIFIFHLLLVWLWGFSRSRQLAKMMRKKREERRRKPFSFSN